MDVNTPPYDIVLSADEIAAGVERVAQELLAAVPHPVLISVVPGGIFMAADLARRLPGTVEMDVISCPHTPGERRNTSEIFYPATVPIDGRNVVVVDDAIESGGTMLRLVEHLRSFGPNTISTATALVRSGRVEIPVRQFFGVELDTEEPLIGYGLPWNHQYRGLPAIARLP